jgi:hypothetical protein
MIEIHGWIRLRYSDYDSQEPLQRDFLYAVQQHLRGKYTWLLTEGHGTLRSCNGLDSFTLAVQHNHKGEPFYPLELFTWVAHHSTGSYGLLYVHDDEDEHDHNVFQVYVLKRGQVLKQADSFLSPYLEEVERDYDSENPPLD